MTKQDCAVCFATRCAILHVTAFKLNSYGLILGNFSSIIRLRQRVIFESDSLNSSSISDRRDRTPERFRIHLKTVHR